MKQCVICGKEFTPKTRLQKTCSSECSYKLLAETRRRNSKTYYERHKNEEEFKERRRGYSLNYQKDRYKKDEAYKEKKQAYGRDYYHKRKEENKGE